MDKSAPPLTEEQSRFTEPEMEAALQLIQLSGESEVDLHGHGLCNSSREVLAKRRRKEVLGDHDESQGSGTSDVTSAPRRFVDSRFEIEDDNDVAGSRRRKRKKFRSIIEIYEISRK